MNIDRLSPPRDPLQRTLDSLRVGFQVIDFTWRYVYVNPAAAAHGRKTVADLQGKTMEEAFPGISQTDMFRALKRCMDERIPEVFDNLFAFPGGESRWFDVRVEPVPEGICVYSMDIHERKLWQLELEARVGAEDEKGDERGPDGGVVYKKGRRFRSFVTGEGER